MTLLPLILSSVLVITGSTVSSAQTWNEVCADRDRYIWAEGWGDSVEEADREALTALTGKISLTIVSSFRSVEGKASHGKKSEGYSSIESSLRTFSSASLNGSGFEILERGRRCHVVRWIAKEEIERVRDRRTKQVRDYISEAQANEAVGRISAAIRGYYWAYAMVRAYPELALTESDSSSGGSGLLSEWLPVKINGLLSGLRVRVDYKGGREAILAFSYDGRPVSGIEFRYYDGCGWSGILNAHDGNIRVRLRYNITPEYLHFRYEYSFLDEVHPESELYCALEYISGEPMRKSYITIPFSSSIKYW